MHVEKLFFKEKIGLLGIKSTVEKLTKINQKMRSVAFHAIMSTGNIFGDARCSMDDAPSVHLSSLGGRCISSATT